MSDAVRSLKLYFTLNQSHHMSNHNRDAHILFANEIFSGRQKSPNNLPRLHARAFTMYIVRELIAGRPIRIKGLGIIFGVYRPRMFKVGLEQPPTYRIRLKVTPTIRIQLRALAAKTKTAFDKNQKQIHAKTNNEEK